MKIRLYLFGAITFAVVAALMVFCTFVLFYLSASKKENSLTTYQVTKYNTFTNETLKGLVRIPVPLADDEFISFRSSDKIMYSIISKISSDEYKCYGTCLCNENQLSRRNANILSRSLFFIVSAISVSIAVNISKTFFREQCLLSLENCDEDYVVVDLEKCEKKKKLEVVFDEDLSDYDDDSEVSYTCEGHCLSNNKIRLEDVIKKRDEFGCKEKWVDWHITVKVPPDRIGNSVWTNSQARNEFRREILKPFCRDNSVYKELYEYTRKEKQVKAKDRVYKYFDTPSRFKKEIHMCIANNGRDQNVWCKLIRFDKEFREIFKKDLESEDWILDNMSR